MPFNSEELAKKFGASAEDVKKSLEGMLGAADDVDRVFEKMTERQEAAAQIMDKFEKAVSVSSKGLTVFGHAGISASRGIKTIDSVSKSAANSLVAIGVGAASAMDGLKAMSGGASSFTTDITGSVNALDNLIQKVNALPKNINVGVAGVGAAVKLPKPPRKASVTPATPPASPLLSPVQSAKQAKVAGNKAATKYMEEYLKQLKQNTGKMKIQLAMMKDKDGDVSSGNKDQYVELSGIIAENEALKDNIEWMSDAEKATFELAAANAVGATSAEKAAAAMNDLKSSNAELSLSMMMAKKAAIEAAEDEISVLAKLDRQVQKDAKSFGDLFKKSFASGGVEMNKFMDGLGGNAVGMTAAGVAGAYLATKLGDVAKEFASAAISLAKYKTETAAVESVIRSMSQGELENMRKQLSLTRDQAETFFDVVRRGVNELGMSQSEIMAVSKALQDTFGGDQTERLKRYVDLLQTIPTIKTDLSITASMDDQTAAVFGLIQTEQLDVALDLKEAGLFGGQQEKKPGADMANASQKTAAATEGIHDFLMNTLYKEWGFKFSAIVEETSKAAGFLFSVAGVVGALSFLTKQAMSENTRTRDVATKEIIAAVEASSVTGRVSYKTTSAPMKGLSKLTKGLGIAALATFGLEMGFNALETHMDKTGNATGAAGAKIAQSGSAMAGMALTGATLGSMVFPGLGTAIGGVVGGLAGLLSQSDNLKEAWGKLSSGIDKDVKVLSSYDAAVGLSADMLKSSAQELSTGLKSIEDAFGSAKYKLSEFNKAVADAAINLASMTGTGGQFRETAIQKSQAIQATYQQKMQDYTKKRADLDQKTNLLAEHRIIAVAKIENERIKAEEEFISEIGKLTEELFRSPEIIRAGIAASFSKRTLEIGEQGGTLGSAEKSAEEQNQRTALSDQMDKTFTQSVESVTEYGQRLKDVEKAAGDRRIEAQKRIADMTLMFDKDGKTQRMRDAEERRNASKQELEDFLADNSKQFEKAKVLKERYEKAAESEKSLKGNKGESNANTLAMLEEQAKIVRKGEALQAAVNQDQQALLQATAQGEALLEEKSRLSKITTNKDVWAEMLKERVTAAEEISQKIESEKKKLEGMGSNSPEATKTVGIVSSLQSSLSVNQQEQQIYKQLLSGVSSENLLQRKVLDLRQQIADVANQQYALEDTAANTFDGNYRTQENAVKRAEASAILASKTGDAIAENAKLAQERVKLDMMGYSQYMDSAKTTLENLGGQKVMMKKVADLRSELANNEKTPANDALIKLLDVTSTEISGLMGRNQKLAVETQKKAGDVADRWSQTGDLLVNALNQVEQSAAGVQLKNLRELSNAMIEGAQYTGGREKASRDSFEMSKKAASEKRKLDKIAMEKELNSEADLMEGKITAARELAIAEAKAKGKVLREETFSDGSKIKVMGYDPGKTPEEMGKAAEVQTRMIEEGRLADVKRMLTLKSEMEQFKSIEESAQNIKNAEVERLDIQQGLIDDAMSFASDFGGSFASIMQLQKMDVGVARQQLDVAMAFRDRVIEAFEAGEGWAQDGTAMLKANADVANKTLGLRRKELGVQKDMMERMLGSIFGELNANFGARRQRGSDQSLMGVGATRMKTAGGVYVNAPGGAPGTIAERQAQRMTAGVGGVFAGGGTTDQGFVGDVERALKTAPARSPVEAALGKAAGTAAVATGMGTATSGGQTMAGRAAGTAVAPPSVGNQVAAAGAAKGAGGAAATEGTTIKVTGEMLVHFDGGAFKDQMAKVMGSLITTPEIAKAIQGVAFQR